MPVVLQHVIHAVPVNTMTKPVKRLNLLLVKVVVQGNTKTKWEKHRAKDVVLAHTMTKPVKPTNPLAKTIAMLVRILTPTRVRV